MHIGIVNIPSRDRSIRVDSPREGTLIEARTRVRSVERCDCAILIQQEPVVNKVRVDEDSQDAAVRSKSPAKCTLAGAGAPTREIECCDQAILVPQKAVNRRGCVEVEPCNVSTRRDREA